MLCWDNEMQPSCIIPWAHVCFRSTNSADFRSSFQGDKLHKLTLTLLNDTSF